LLDRDPYTDTITTLYKLYYHALSAIKVLPTMLFLVGSIPLPMVRVYRRLSIHFRLVAILAIF
jgi:hypothetical protein